MNEEQIKQLLERYWQCDTSLEEEHALQQFFSTNNLPEDLKNYQSLFIRNHKQLEIRADKKLLAKVNKPLQVQLYSVLKVAASVLILLTVGIGFSTHYQQEKQMDKLFSDTYTDPEDAVKETEQVVAKISSVLQLIQEKIIQDEMLDSIQLKESSVILEQNQAIE